MLHADLNPKQPTIRLASWFVNRDDCSLLIWFWLFPIHFWFIKGERWMIRIVWDSFSVSLVQQDLHPPNFNSLTKSFLSDKISPRLRRPARLYLFLANVFAATNLYIYTSSIPCRAVHAARANVGPLPLSQSNSREKEIVIFLHPFNCSLSLPESENHTHIYSGK